MEPTMTEFEKMPIISDVAFWCDFEEDDDLEGLLI